MEVQHHVSCVGLAGVRSTFGACELLVSLGRTYVSRIVVLLLVRLKCVYGWRRNVRKTNKHAGRLLVYRGKATALAAD